MDSSCCHDYEVVGLYLIIIQKEKNIDRYEGL